MLKKRYFSVYGNFKTGILCKITLFFGLLLLFIYILIELISFIAGEGSTGFLRDIYDFSKTTYPNTILSFSIIILAIAVILYFFYCQFIKLAKIADEIESEEDLNEPIEK